MERREAPVLFHTPATAAKVLNVSRNRVLQMLDEGVMPLAATTTTGRKLLDPADVQELALRRMERNGPSRSKAIKR